MSYADARTFSDKRTRTNVSANPSLYLTGNGERWRRGQWEAEPGGGRERVRGPVPAVPHLSREVRPDGQTAQVPAVQPHLLPALPNTGASKLAITVTVYLYMLIIVLICWGSNSLSFT